MTTVPAPAPAPASASIGRRVGAVAIDIAIAYAVLIVLGAVGGVVAVGAARASDGDSTALAAVIVLVYGLLFLAVAGWAVVYTAMQGGRGSIGQRAVRIRMLDARTGAPIGFWRAVLRNIVWYITASFVVGWFTPLFDSSGRRQGWHDMAGGALVVDTRGAAPDVVRAVPTLAVPVPAPGASGVAAPAPLANPFVPAAPGAVPAPAPSPFAAPSAPAPAPAPAPRIAPPVAGYTAAPAALAHAPASGLIDSVPGVTPPSTSAAPRTSSAPAPPPAPVTPAPSPTSAPAAAPASTARADVAPELPDDLEATRVAGAADRSPATPASIAVLTWDDGTRLAVHGRTLFGRNPAAEDGVRVVAVRDETLSLSKTHFEIGGDASGVWVADRHSTNGTTLIRDGERVPLIAGTHLPLRRGDRLEFGDRSAEIGGLE